MKVVLDTNVLVSGIFWSGAPARVLSAWFDGRFGMVVTPRILEEYDRVAYALARRIGFEEVGQILTAVKLNADIVDATAILEPICRDPNDDEFIAAARAGGAHHIVSGDKDLLVLERVDRVQILTAIRFLRELSCCGKKWR